VKLTVEAALLVVILPTVRAARPEVAKTSPPTPLYDCDPVILIAPLTALVVLKEAAVTVPATVREVGLEPETKISPTTAPLPILLVKLMIPVVVRVRLPGPFTMPLKDNGPPPLATSDWVPVPKFTAPV